MSALIATTHVDSEGDRIMRCALEDMAEQSKRRYIPVLFGHDPRKPPLGRITSSRVVELTDGEFGLVAESEMWEESDRLQDIVGDGREIPIPDYEVGSWTLVYDRSFLGASDAATIRDVGELLRSDPQLEIKKAQEPLSLLTLGAAFVATTVTAAVLQEIAKDGYQLVKEKLKALLARKRSSGREVVFRIEFAVRSDDHWIVAELFVTNPDDSELERFLVDGPRALEKEINGLLRRAAVIARAVYEYGPEGKPELKFYVRRDGVPFES